MSALVIVSQRAESAPNIRVNRECGSTLVEVLVALMLVSISTAATAKFLSSMDQISRELPVKREGLTQQRYLAEHLVLGSAPNEISALWPDLSLTCNQSNPRVCNLASPASANLSNNQSTFSVTIR